MGRLVLTHSTYLEGLVPFLKRLVKIEGIKTITPGEIRRVKGKCDKPRIKISTSLEYGFKLIARRGYTAQEVFITTTLDEFKLTQSLKTIGEFYS